MKPLVQLLCVSIEVSLYLLLLAASWHLLRQARWAKRRGPIDASDLEGLPAGELPFVTIQLPLRNEAAVAEDLLRCVTAITWPRERLQIQVLDDSDDETSALLDSLVDQLRASGHPIELLRRTDRAGFKAGNLAHGLGHARGELILVLDADSQPEPDLLERLHRALTEEPALAFVQARWSFRNAEAGLLQRLQGAILDALFVTEQARLGHEQRPVQFNGTAGLWRRGALEAAGGWLGGSGERGSITEDLDLSLRANEIGLRGRTIPDISVSTELPGDMRSFVTQQARWVRGGGLALRTFALRMSRTLSASSLLATLGHLSRHARQPLVVAASLRLALVAWHRAHPVCPPWVGPSVLLLTAIATTAYLDTARRRIGAQRAPYLGPAMIALSIGLAPRLSSAFVGGVLGFRGEGFVRTQKGGARSEGRRTPSLLEAVVLGAAAIAAVGFLETQDAIGLLAALLVAFSVLWVSMS